MVEAESITAGAAGTTSGRWVLVTGASSGIGRAATRSLAETGFRVIATARADADLEELRAEGLEALRMDLADPDAVELAAGRSLSLAGGRLWGLVNNAAMAVPGALEDLDRSALEAQFRVNILGTHQLTQLLLPAMLEHGEGRIVNVSSLLGMVAMPRRGAYSASKFALEGMTDALRMELAGTGVEVSLVVPGPVRSRFRINAQSSFDEHVDETRSRHAARYRRMRKERQDPDGRLPFSVAPEKVARSIRHALTARRPRARYWVTTPTWVMGTLKRLLPTRLMDALIRRM